LRIWLAVKVNKEKYKNPGNFYWVGTKLRLNTKEESMTQGIHTVFHFKKIKSMVNQYLDRATIMEAMKK
jgi:hypothetical protein